jgi:hypothetical protein
MLSPIDHAFCRCRIISNNIDKDGYQITLCNISPEKLHQAPCPFLHQRKYGHFLHCLCPGKQQRQNGRVPIVNHIQRETLIQQWLSHSG